MADCGGGGCGVGANRSNKRELFPGDGIVYVYTRANGTRPAGRRDELRVTGVGGGGDRVVRAAEIARGGGSGKVTPRGVECPYRPLLRGSYENIEKALMRRGRHV